MERGSDGLRREVLPIPDIRPVTLTLYDTKEAIAADAKAVDHLITPQEAMAVAMARQ